MTLDCSLIFSFSHSTNNYEVPSLDMATVVYIWWLFGDLVSSAWVVSIRAEGSHPFLQWPLRKHRAQLEFPTSHLQLLHHSSTSQMLTDSPWPLPHVSLQTVCRDLGLAWADRFGYTSGVCSHSALNFVKNWMMKLHDVELGKQTAWGFTWLGICYVSLRERKTTAKTRFCMQKLLSRPKRQLGCHFYI